MNHLPGPTIVIVAYRPKPGHESTLLQLTREHVPLLRAEGLATDHPTTTAQAADGTLIEVFEWRPRAIEKAHANPRVLALWQRYSQACDIIPLKDLPESATMFASFRPL